MSAAHPPDAFARDLASKLATRARHVCVLLGAGASASAGLPTIAGLQAAALASLSPGDRTLFEKQLTGRNLEQGLSRLRRIRGLLSEGESLDGLTADKAAELDHAICGAIIGAVDITGKDASAFVKLASWASRLESSRPVEIFTVNYDLLIETGLEQIAVPYFDGFIGSVRGRFAPELIEPTESRADLALPPGFVRVWKLHGSVNWQQVAIGGVEHVVRGTQPSPDAAAIYPSDEKYEQSRRVPFVTLMDRFRRALAEPETLTIVAGYSFGDEHLNETIFDAAQRHPRCEVVVFAHGDIQGEVEMRALSTPNIIVCSPAKAIIGGQARPWDDTDEVPGVFESGKLVLGDFEPLSSFLARQDSADAGA